MKTIPKNAPVLLRFKDKPRLGSWLGSYCGIFSSTERTHYAVCSHPETKEESEFVFDDDEIQEIRWEN